jgi:hypothetical protein
MPETPDDVYDVLKRRARASGVYLAHHQHYDPTRGGDLYVMEQKSVPNPNPRTFIAYATPKQAADMLTRIEKAIFRGDFGIYLPTVEALKGAEKRQPVPQRAQQTA